MAQPTRLLVLQRPDQPLEALCARLREWGGELVSCDSYHGAAAALAAEGADIVLIDAWIEDGLPLLTQLKSSAATRYLPIVIVTAEEPAAVAAHALALGADDGMASRRDGRRVGRPTALTRLDAASCRPWTRQATPMQATGPLPTPRPCPRAPVGTPAGGRTCASPPGRPRRSSRCPW